MLTFQDVVAASIASSDSSSHSLNMSSISGMSSNDSATTCSTSIFSTSHSMNRSPRDSHSKRVDSCSLSLSPGESLSHKASLSFGGKVSESDFTSHPHLFADGVDMLDHLTLSSLHNTLELLPGWHQIFYSALQD